MKAATLAPLLIAALPAFAHVPNHGHPQRAPERSYDRAAKAPPKPDEHAIGLHQMPSYHDRPGEFGHLLVGRDHGFERLSLAITETRPGGGPPLHSHETEEANVLLSGTARYVIVDPASGKRKVFTVQGPFVVRIPARHPHAFVNTGREAFSLIAAFPEDRFTYRQIGPNPLLRASAAAQPAPDKPGSKPRPKPARKVHIVGCPVKGVESGCLVIKDGRGNTYDISSSKAAPGTHAIDLTGTVDADARSICMQGQILKDIRWHYTKGKCAGAPGGKATQ